MRILVLSTWFPYPLSIGSKIRAYHLMRALAQRHEVSLVSFADTVIEPASLDHVKQFCRHVEIVERDPFATDRLRRSLGWLSPQPSFVFATHSPEMARRLGSLASDWRPDRIVATTFIGARYALKLAGIPKVVDLENIMAGMSYETYLQATSLPKRVRRLLAWWKTRRYEKWLYGQFDLCLVVSGRDHQLLKAMLMDTGNIGIVPNGVDTTFNRPGLATPEPNTLVFNGALTYGANYDAMDYFLREIFPSIARQVPDVHLTITGATHGVPIETLASDDRVRFTGYLEDVRPAVAGSWACVVPLRAGGGTRIKILEAMALGTPIVCTSKGAEGLDVEAGRHLLIADTPDEFARQTVRLLQETELRTTLTRNAVQLVQEKYNWAIIGNQFCDLVENATVA